MDVYEPGSRRRNKARERSMVRENRKQVINNPLLAGLRERLSGIRIPGLNAETRQQAGKFGRDLLWYVVNVPQIRNGLLGLIAVAFGFFVLSHILPGRIFPGVSAAGIDLGGLPAGEATTRLITAWQTDTRLTLVDGANTWEVNPADLGLQIDASATVESARGVGMAGIPLGYSITPVVTIDTPTARNYLLDLTTQTDVPPYNAGYGLTASGVVGIAGQDGRSLNVAGTIQALQTNIEAVARTRRLDLVMNPIPPNYDDPAPFLEQAQRLVANPPVIVGYDPFLNQSVRWATSPAEFATWLEVEDDGLGLRADAYAPFLDAQTRSLNPDGTEVRYLDPLRSKDLLREAINTGVSEVIMRIQYRPQSYTIQAGDAGFRISRRMGIPFFNIQQANPNRDWDQMFPGETINLPPADITLPLDPVPTKRIVVNLNQQFMVAFENNQVRYAWLISSGLEQYPTSPGTYQILSKEAVARGSSFTLCANGGGDCGQWEMYWFMGMYEIAGGVMNGFHGAVLLPNGAYLGGGNVGAPYTFGCVMSRDDEAEVLFNWAEEGVIVEVISNEYLPKSDLGQLVWTQPLSAFQGQSQASTGVSPAA
jgi:lipoprotein-anchoring transpeptidase ErfK/SrfK